MKSTLIVAVCSLALTSLVGCSGAPEDASERLGTATERGRAFNGKSLNGKSLNGMKKNGMKKNGLAPSATRWTR
jgi:hypothetical protein